VPPLHRSPRLLALLALLVHATACDRSPNGPTSFDVVAADGAQSRIAFVSNRDGNNEIYVMNADGSGVTRLTDNPANDTDPTWSPDGSRIAFSSTRAGNYDVYVMNADGSGVTRLTNDQWRDRRPAWCGTRIAFQSDRYIPPFYDIYMMNEDGTGQTRVTLDNASSDEYPAWSPSCDRIAYSYDPDGTAAQILVMNADGSGNHGLVTTPGRNRNPAWLTDGTRIAFASDTGRQGTWDIYVMNADGTQRTRLTEPAFHTYDYATWSPDGTKIAFVVLGTSAIRVMNADGSGMTLLADSASFQRIAWTGLSASPPPPPPPPVPPPPPPPVAWANEPAGFTVLSDEPFNALDENGWWSVQSQTTNGSGLYLAADSGAPSSPSGVLQFTYAVGFEGGSAPGVEFYGPPAPVRETYFAFWWKVSDPWQNHESDINAIADLFPATSAPLYIIFKGSTQTLDVMPQFDNDSRDLTPNVTTTSVTLGTWHLVEWYVKYSSTATSRDGVTRWWVDGVLQGDYRDLQMPDDAGFVEYDLAPTWGGVEGTKTQTDFFRFDHVRISTP